MLYIVGTVAGIFSKVIAYFPVQDADDPLAYAAEHSDAVTTGALFVLVMGLSLAFVPVVLFPVLRRVDEVLAMGYLVIRGAIETAVYVVLAIALLLLVPLGETMAAGSGTDSPAGVRLGALVIDAEGATAVLTWCSASVRCCSTFCSTGRASFPAGSRRGDLRGSRSTPPRTCSRCTESSRATPPLQNVLQVPVFVQEMVLAVWMIARGFRPAVTSATEPERYDGGENLRFEGGKHGRSAC